MDKNTQTPTNNVFNGLELGKPLKPLSIYSRMIFSEQEAGLQQIKSSNPFINFKIEVVNICANKRKLEFSSSDDGYETPAKKDCSPQDLSPDLGCFMDYCSPPATEDSVSPFSISSPELLDETKTVRREVIESAGSQLHLEHVACGSSAEPGVDKGSVPDRLVCQKVLLNLAPAFDCDVEDILCLNPYGNVESCQSPSRNTFQYNVSPIVSGPVLESHTSHVEPLEGDVEEAWNIGSPIFESSISQAALAGEDDTLDTSYETTLPLQVKVKSVVVALSQQTSSGKTAARVLCQSRPLGPTCRAQMRTESQRLPNVLAVPGFKGYVSFRPAIFDKKGDWEREKQLYVQSVTRHMKEHKGDNQDVMTELMTLMTHVADQKPGTDGRRWQHPSDLTRRNYQTRFGNDTPKMTLHEWHTKNGPEHKRFAEVPKMFHRSQFP
ncbi:S100P-binding protein-like [Anoplopoma fimbria]|uniref:S100P-binding protein-like n=1 Tax=Anoplopoma fimbria TaxID=229290 RepID=UPI0023EA85AE|nr:S100P-binding protein-like [Anoplopoma fimbria]